MDIQDRLADSRPATRPVARRPGLLVPLALVPLLLAGSAMATDAPSKQEWSIEPFEWHGSPAAGQTLTVRNPWGDVRARRIDGSEVALYAVKQHHRDDPRPWRVAIAEGDDGLTVDVSIEDADEAAEPPIQWARRRLDLTIYVPAASTLRAETTTGLIEAKRLASRVEARSTRGEIVVTTTGSVDARSAEGRIRYSSLTPSWTGSARLVTGSGDIALALPRDADLDLSIRTGGEITADEALAPTPGEPRAIHAVAGRGTGRVVAESATGNVVVRRIRSEGRGR
jgi:hypothetical protein